ncbi:pro-Pol polyprotein [Trichonephila clavipes]|uniref:Pro-Pol polyprotein n=1 Tax=Trichonephila clavipes TaxID=2585209 RepID=A0A8X6VMA8_TRICX|nr:pro-Pol polyprotein [Trichonephila clavipes]
MIFIQKFSITCRVGLWNKQMPYFSSVSDEWSRDLKTTKEIPVVFMYRNSVHVEVPNKSDEWDYFFSSLENVSDELKPKVLLCMLGDKVSNLLVNLGEEELKNYESLKQVVLRRKSYDGPARAKWNDSEKRSFNGSWGKQPFGEKKSDNFSSRKNFDKGQVTEIKKFACFTCGSDKHFKRDCPKNKEVDNKRLNVNKMSTEGTELEDGMVAARVDLLALVDSGTEITVIKKDLVLGIPIEGASTIYLKGIFGPAVKCPLVYVPIGLATGGQVNVVHQQVLCALAEVLVEDLLLTPVARPELPFQVVNMDLIGPIDPPSSKGQKYILCLVDQHTRWGEAVPLTSLSAKVTCEALLSIFSRTGIPNVVASDNWTNFAAELTRLDKCSFSAKRIKYLGHTIGGGGACKDLLPAPGNRSNETHDIERRIWKREREESERGRKGKRGREKRGRIKEDTAGRWISLEQRAKSNSVFLLEESSETLEMLKKAHKSDASTKGVLPASMAVKIKLTRHRFKDSDEVIRNTTKQLKDI